LYLKLGGRARILIDIQFRNAVSAVRFGGELFHDWPHHATRPTPWRPRVDKYWTTLALEYCALKARVSNDERLRFRGSIVRFAHIQRRSTLAALRNLLRGLPRIDAILSSTLAASYDVHSFALFRLLMINIY
jgi:hypothetical protein